MFSQKGLIINITMKIILNMIIMRMIKKIKYIIIIKINFVVLYFVRQKKENQKKMNF